MRKTRRTEVTVEVDEILVIRHSGRTSLALCPRCPGPVMMILPEEAALLGGMSVRAVYRWAETSTGHCLETPDGQLLICPRSLSENPPSPGGPPLVSMSDG